MGRTIGAELGVSRCHGLGGNQVVCTDTLMNYFTSGLAHYFFYLETKIIATFKLQYEFEFPVLSTRFRFGGRNFSKCACSELKTRTRSRPRTPI